VISDSHIKLDYPNIQVIYTGQGQTGPAEKRDIAIKQCKGEICAFIDDDAFPAKDWLKNAMNHFENQEVAAVGGPGVTPENDSLMQKAGGAVYSSILGSGRNYYRFTPGILKEVDDYPAYNLLIRKSILQEIGGFASTFYGGEDTKVCLSIIDLGKKIIYDPTVVVYHHRRPLFINHLKQIKNVGIHRGYFVKAYPKTSRNFFYFLPSIICIVLGFSILLSFFSKPVMTIFFTMLGMWLIAGFISALRINKDIKIAFLAAFGIIATHFIYGIAFLKGLTLKDLQR
jgi:GT2 family glycosyltransferase